MEKEKYIEEYVKTNMRLMPLVDYLEIQAYQCGYSSYADMKKNGIGVDLSNTEIIRKTVQVY